MVVAIQTLDRRLICLTVIAAVNTAISAYYYVKVLRTMYLEGAEEGASELRIPALGEALVAAHVVAVIYFGLFFGRLAEWTQQIGSLHQ